MALLRILKEGTRSYTTLLSSPSYFVKDRPTNIRRTRAPIYPIKGAELPTHLLIVADWIKKEKARKLRNKEERDLAQPSRI